MKFNKKRKKEWIEIPSFFSRGEKKRGKKKITQKTNEVVEAIIGVSDDAPDSDCC